jgi:SAM-dependent methyltransferase
MDFDPRAYWEQRNAQRRQTGIVVSESYAAISGPPPYATPNFRDRAHQREWIIQQVSRFGWRSVLDAGCGIGLWFYLWNELGMEAAGVDQAPSAIEWAQETVADIGAAFSVSVAQLDRLPFETRSFDVAVTSKVLLHTVPNEIEAALAELGRVARHLLLLEMRLHDKPLNQHVFPHDYLGLADRLGFEVLVSEIFPGDHHYLVMRSPER